jgi:hypothetical protein
LDHQTGRCDHTDGSGTEGTIYNDSELLGVKLRDSKLFYTRNFYEHLYQTIMTMWEFRAIDSDDVQHAQLVLTGNAGTGKSYFQLYLLHRLLNERTPRYRFVVRQVEKSFYLYDLTNCRGWELTSCIIVHVLP